MTFGDFKSLTRGWPSLAVEVTLDSGASALAQVPGGLLRGLMKPTR